MKITVVKMATTNMKKSVLATEAVIMATAAVSMNTDVPMIIASTDTTMIIASAAAMPVDVGVIMSMGIN